MRDLGKMGEDIRDSKWRKLHIKNLIICTFLQSLM
jgi:hypothetical protein